MELTASICEDVESAIKKLKIQLGVIGICMGLGEVLLMTSNNLLE